MSLQIQGDMQATVKFNKEPRSRIQGEKTLRDGTVVPDVRRFVSVTYLSGTARSKRTGEDALPAVVGQEYTLWLGSTLLSAILEIMGHEEGDDAPVMTDTIWRIWRGDTGFGGHRVYEAEKLDSLEDVPEVDPEEGLMLMLKDTILKIGELPKKDWYSYCADKGVEDAEAFTEKMEKAGYLTTDTLMVKKPGN
jgi:hypothetical protein